MQPRRLLTSSSPGQNLCRITAAYPANDLLRPLPPQGRGLFISNYRDTNGAVNVYGLCGFSTHWPGGHCQGTPSLTLTIILNADGRVYPACAGIDLYDKTMFETREGLPRLRGDRPVVEEGGVIDVWFTPHARGSTVQRWGLSLRVHVYPAC